MPALSPTMTAGNIGAWHKKVGDEIVPGDVLVEIETDKAQMDFECQDEGFLAKVFMEAGSKDVQVNLPIAILAENKADIAAFADYVPSTEAVQEVAPVEAEGQPQAAPVEGDAVAKDVVGKDSGVRKFVSPVAKKIASEKGVDVSAIDGTGPHGRVVKADVEKVSAAPAVKAAPAPAPVTSKAVPPKTAAPLPSAAAGSFTDLPLSNVRKIIASRLQESKSTIPHYYLSANITMDKVTKLRQVFNEQAKDQFKLSVNDFVIKAAALALKQVPEVNSSWGGDFIRKNNSVDISVAVSTPAGLITPIITSADVRGLASISNSVRDLATRARDNKLAPAEYQGGTFTISNLGMFGVDSFAAIINPPQSCILAVGATQKVLVPVEDGEGDSGVPYSIVSQMNVTLSCDHRVVDGAVGAQWLSKFKFYLENPLTMML